MTQQLASGRPVTQQRASGRPVTQQRALGRPVTQQRTSGRVRSACDAAAHSTLISDLSIVASHASWAAHGLQLNSARAGTHRLFPNHLSPVITGQPLLPVRPRSEDGLGRCREGAGESACRLEGVGDGRRGSCCRSSE